MRILALGLLLATPALADDGPSYDPKVLAACLDRTAGDTGNTRVCIGEASTACMAGPGGDTTVGMVDCLAAETKDWDALLNREYARVLKGAEAADAELAGLGSAADPAAPMLKAAQRAWIAFRDSSCRYAAATFQGGTGGGPAAQGCMMQLTGEQALRLRDMGKDMEGGE